MAFRQEAASLLVSLARPTAAAASASTSSSRTRRPASRRSYSAAGTAEIRQSEPVDDALFNLRLLRPEPELPVASGSGTISLSTMDLAYPSSSPSRPPVTLTSKTTSPDLSYPSTSFGVGARRPTGTGDLSSVPSRAEKLKTEETEKPSTSRTSSLSPQLYDPNLVPASTLALAKRLSESRVEPKEGWDEFKAMVNRDLRADCFGVRSVPNSDRKKASYALNRLVSLTVKWRKSMVGASPPSEDFDLAWRRFAAQPGPLKRQTEQKRAKVPAAQARTSPKMPAVVSTAASRPDAASRITPAPPPPEARSPGPTLSNRPAMTSLQPLDRRQPPEPPVLPKPAVALPSARSKPWPSVVLGQSTSQASTRSTNKSTTSSLQRLADVHTVVKRRTLRPEPDESTASGSGAISNERSLSPTSLASTASLSSSSARLPTSSSSKSLRLFDPELVPASTLALAKRFSESRVKPKEGWDKFGNNVERELNADCFGFRSLPHSDRKKAYHALNRLVSLTVKRRRSMVGASPPSEDFDLTWRRYAALPMVSRKALAQLELAVSPPPGARSLAPTSSGRPTKASSQPLDRPQPSKLPLSSSTVRALSSVRPGQSLSQAPPLPTLESTMSSLRHLIDVYASSLTPFASGSGRSPVSATLSFAEALEARQRQAKIQQAKDVLELTREALQGMFPESKTTQATAVAAAHQAVQDVTPLPDRSSQCSKDRPSPVRLLPAVKGSTPPAKSALVRQALAALEQHTPSTDSSSTTEPKADVRKSAAVDANSAASETPAKASLAEKQSATPARPLGPNGAAIVQSQLVTRTQAATAPPLPAPLPQTEAVDSPPTLLSLSMSETRSAETLNQCIRNQHEDPSDLNPIITAIRSAKTPRDLQHIVQRLEKTATKAGTIETGDFWTALNNKARMLLQPFLAALPMIKADLLCVEPPTPSQKTILREALYSMLQPVAHEKAGLPVQKQPMVPPLTCRSLRLVLNASPNDPVLCALVLKGFALLGPAGADDFHEFEEVILTRSASAPFEPVPGVDPARSSQHAVWALEALDSIRPFVHPNVLRCWAGVIDPGDVHYHRSRLIALADHFGGKSKAKTAGLASTASFPLPEMPPAIRLIDAYVEASLSSPTVARDAYARYFADRAYARAESREGAREMLESNHKRFGPVDWRWPVLDEPLARHARWASAELGDVRGQSQKDVTDPLDLWKAIRRAVQSADRERPSRKASGA